MKSLLFFNIYEILNYYFSKNVCHLKTPQHFRELPSEILIMHRTQIEIYSNLEAYVCHDNKSNFSNEKKIYFSSKFSVNPFLNAYPCSGCTVYQLGKDSK